MAFYALTPTSLLLIPAAASFSRSLQSQIPGVDKAMVKERSAIQLSLYFNIERLTL